MTEKLSENNFVSGGKNPNVGPTCGYPVCSHLQPSTGGYDGGWCTLESNRVPPSEGWPTGFTPSVASTGGCDGHARADTSGGDG